MQREEMTADRLMMNAERRRDHTSRTADAGEADVLRDDAED